MLYDKCILTKRDNSWVGFVEICQRIGENWRFAAWIMVIILVIELFRLSLAGIWYFHPVEYCILGLSAFFGVAFFRRSSKTERHREMVFRLPPADPVTDEVGQTLGYSQTIELSENGTLRPYPISSFTHIVFGLIDYPWPGRKNVSIDAFALYLAGEDGSAHPIVEGCFDKATCYSLGRRLSALTKIPMIEMGKGQPFVG